MLKPQPWLITAGLVTQALQGEPLTIFGDGSQTRSYCYFSDLLEGIYKLMQSDIHSPVNLGNPVEVSVLELADIILRLTGSKSSLINRELPPDEPRVRQPDISKARNLLDWQPQITLEDGLQRTIEWFKANN